MGIIEFLNQFAIVDIFMNYMHYFFVGARATVLISLVTVVGGVIVGCTIALMRLSTFNLLSKVARVYVTVIRGTPLLVQLYIVYFQLDFITFPSVMVLGVDTARVIPCIIALIINSGAYVAEIVRAGIQAVDIGQSEASRSVGMSYGKTMLHVVLPQAIKNILPAIGNEFVTMIKETAVIQYLGVGDLMYYNGVVIVYTYNPLPCYYISALIYLVLNLVTGSGVNLLERRLQKSDRLS